MKFDRESTDGYLTDKDAEQKGVRVEINDTVAFVLRRAGGANKAYLRALEKAYRANRKKIDQEMLHNDELEDEVMRPLFIKHCIAGWDGVTAEGKPVPFTEQACEAFFRQVPDVYRALREFASDMDTFLLKEQREVIEQAGKS